MFYLIQLIAWLLIVILFISFLVVELGRREEDFSLFPTEEDELNHAGSSHLHFHRKDELDQFKEEKEMKKIMMGVGRYSNGRMTYTGADGKGFSRTVTPTPTEEKAPAIKPVDPVQPVEMLPFMKKWVEQKQTKQAPIKPKKSVFAKILEDLLK